MNNNSFWHNLKAWLQDEKTKFDLVDRSRALFFLIAIMLLIKLLLDFIYE